MTPTSACMLVVQETVALCKPEGGLITWKIRVRMVAVVPESVPGSRTPVTPPSCAVMLVAVFALIVTMIIAARLAPLPMTKAGVVTVVAPNLIPELTLLSKVTPGLATVSETVAMWV